MRLIQPFLVGTFACLNAAAAAETAKSPDGKVVATVEVKDGLPRWSVAHGDNPIIRDGLLGAEIAPDSFSGKYTLVGTETATGNTTWKPVWGFLSEVRDHYHELTLKLQETAAPQRLLHVVLRAYNEGVAVRYVFPQQPEWKEVTVNRLLTEFAFGGDRVIYTAREYQYGNATIATMKKSEGAVTVALEGGGFVSLTDADRSDFYVPFRPHSFQGGNYVDLDIPAITAYGKSLEHPIGLCLYVRGALLKEFGGEHAIEDVFACYERWGVAGVKPGFVPPSSQENERAIAYMVKKAAEHKLILCIHDAFLPYGLCRTYPNLVNVEGVAGEEAEPSIAPEIKSLHDILLPFTRGIMGPFDYTPQIYKNSKTHCHQVAMLGVYQGRASVRSGMRQWSPGGEGGAEIEFAEKMPGLTDEIKVATDLGKHVSVARRRGANWYVASMSGPQASCYQYSLSFLAPGQAYRASIYRDTPGSRKATHTQQHVTSQSVIPIAMEPNGGHLIIIEAEE